MLSLTAQGCVRYQLKTLSRDGTTHVVLEPLDFIARLAALIPKPRVNLTPYHDAFALRAQQRTARRGHARSTGPAHRNATHRGSENRCRAPRGDELDAVSTGPLCQ